VHAAKTYSSIYLFFFVKSPKEFGPATRHPALPIGIYTRITGFLNKIVHQKRSGIVYHKKAAPSGETKKRPMRFIQNRLPEEKRPLSGPRCSCLSFSG